MRSFTCLLLKVYADSVMALHQNDPMIYCAFDLNSLADSLFWYAMLTELSNRQGEICGSGLPTLSTEEERERKDTYMIWYDKRSCEIEEQKHFEEKHCFTKHFRLNVWLAACLSAEITIFMPDNHESLICQLVGRSIPIKKRHLSDTHRVRERAMKINFVMCTFNTILVCPLSTLIPSNKIATQALSEQWAHSFFRINRVFVIESLLWITCHVV